MRDGDMIASDGDMIAGDGDMIAGDVVGHAVFHHKFRPAKRVVL